MCLSTREGLCQDTLLSDLEAPLALESTLFLGPDYRPQAMAPKIIPHLLRETYCLLAPERSPPLPLRVAARTLPRQ